MRLYRFLPAGLAVALFVGAPPQQVQAQITIPSSMSATCANVSCSQLRFFLNLNETRPLYIKWFELNTAGAWRFGGLNSVVSASTAANYTSAYQSQMFNGGLQLYGAHSATAPPTEPLVITADMANLGLLSDINSFTYSGQSCFRSDCRVRTAGDADVMYDGTVSLTATPEPASTVLLLSGLLGIGGAVARKRRLRRAELV
jgi:hypothetical protein